VSHDLADRFVIVLVRARNPNNIGAAARAMHDFGLRHLRIVSDYAAPLESARSAVDANEILTSSQSFVSIADAVADCTLVVGTTAVGERTIEHPVHTLANAAEKMRSEPGRIALLFGSEKTGLSNEELSHCHWLLTIPMQQYESMRHPSMNLGQAVAVCLYELVRDADAPIRVGTREPARAEEIARFTAVLQEMLEASEYTRRHPSNATEEQIRRLVLRMGLTAADVPVWMGVARQILWKLGRDRTEE
jgi:TrmH family RNA methyltransferase